MSDEIIIDVGALFRALKKKFKVIVLVAVLFAVIGALYSQLKTPVYESFASIRIQQPFGIKTSLEGDDVNPSLINTRMYTYTEILKSRSVIQKVIEENNLTDSRGRFIAYSTYVKDYLSTEKVRDTEILKVSVKDAYPQRAQNVNAQIIELFLNRLTELARGQEKNIRQFLEERVKISRGELANAEIELNAFKRDNVIYTPDDKVDRLSKQMILIDKLRAENTVNLESARAKNSVVSSQLDENTVNLSDNTSLRNYQNKLADLEAQRIEYLEKYTEEHPKVKEVNESIAAIKKALDDEIQKIINKEAMSENENYRILLRDKFESEAQVQVAENNLGALEEIAAQYQTELADLSDTERQFLKLTRELTLAQEIYVMLSKKLEEARVAEASISNEVQLIDEPSLPVVPTEPKATRIIPLAFVVGFVLACLVVVSKELFNSTIRSVEDVRELLKLPVLGKIPLKDDKTDAFITVATNLKHLLKSEPKIISIVSASAKEGKSSVAKNLGIALANENFKVVIVEGDLRKPTKLFDAPATLGIAERVSDATELAKKTGFENLFVVSGLPFENPAQILSNNIVAENFAKLKANFDLVLVDTPAFLTFPDALVLNDYADGLIVVVELNKTELKSVRELKLQLEQVNGNILGVVLNKVSG